MIGAPWFAFSFRQPELWLLALLAVPLIIAYLVEPRRRRGVDPFFFLWERLARPKPLLGRLARVAEFLMLLVALLLIVGAVTDPGSAVAYPVKPMKIVAAVNPGWSDDAPYRSSALAELRALLDAIPPEETGCVVAGGSEGARLVVPPTHGPLALPVLSGRIPGQGDRAPLRAMVVRLLRAFPGAEVHWFDAEPPGDLPRAWAVHRLRRDENDRTITLNLRPGGGRKVVATLANRSDRIWKGALRVDTSDARREVSTVELAGGARRTVALEIPEGVHGELSVALVPAGEENPVARVGHFVPKPVRPALVVIAGRESSEEWRVLLTVFEARIDRERSNLVPADQGLAYLEANRARLRPHDIVVFLAPPARWPDLPVPALLFGGPGPLGRVVAGEPKAGGVASWEREHPVLDKVDFSLLVADAVPRVEPAPGTHVLAAGPDGPMLLYRADPVPMAAFPFRFESSNLMQTWTFISLVNNLVELWGRKQPIVGPLAVGETMPTPPGSDVMRAWRAGEAEPCWEGRDGEGFPLRPRKPGRVRTVGGTGTREAYYNPRPEASAGPEIAPAVSPPEAAPASGTDWRSWVTWLAWAAFVLLLVEWLVYHRGWL